MLGQDSPGDKATRVVLNTAIAGTMATMLAFHFASLGTSSAAPSGSNSPSSPPNLWEMPVFITFMQNAAIVSMANIDQPYAPFALFTDSFSPLLFLIKGSSSDATTNSTRHLLDEATNSSASNDTSYGIQQYAVRLHIKKSDLFPRAWTFFFIVVAAVLFLVCFAAVIGRLLYGKKPTLAEKATGTSDKLFGVKIWLLTQAVSPLTAISVFEAIDQNTGPKGLGTVSGILALVALVVIGSACIATGVLLSRLPEEKLSKETNQTRFGVLFVNMKFDWRFFYCVTLLVQFATGAVTSGCLSPASQMIALIVIHSLYIVILLVAQPYVTRLQLITTVLVEVDNIAVYALSYGQASAAKDDLHTKKILGYAVMGFIGVLVLLFFARTLLKLVSKFTGKKIKVLEEAEAADSLRDPTVMSPEAFEGQKSSKAHYQKKESPVNRSDDLID
ncbi:unnamed protein product [Aphanomyces euteiches]